MVKRVYVIIASKKVYYFHRNELGQTRSLKKKKKEEEDKVGGTKLVS